MSSRRKASLVLARHFAYYVARCLTGASLTQIGRAYKRDHSSVVHAVAKMEELVNVNSSIAEQYRYFENKLAYRQAPHSYWGLDEKACLLLCLAFGKAPLRDTWLGL